MTIAGVGMGSEGAGPGLLECGGVATSRTELGMADTELPPIGDVGDVPELELEVAREQARERLFGARRTAATLGRFTILEHLGAGGMGTVYAAHDPRLDRRVAVKVLRERSESHDVARKTLVAEAQAMAKVVHPNVVTIHDVGEGGSEADGVYIAMELVDGLTLSQWLARRRPPWHAIVDAYLDAGRGLLAVHEAGLVHRDFKPDNVMIDEDGRVRVMDFGLASRLVLRPTLETGDGPGSTLVTSPGPGGTPAYMPPERFRGEAADARGDQFSFCVALYEALWGRRPYPGDDVAALRRSFDAGRGPEPPPRSPVPRVIREAVLRGLALEPSHRWPSMRPLLEALAPRHRRRWLVGAAAVLGFGLGALALSSTGQELPAPCTDAADRFAPAWNADRAEQLHEGLSALDAPDSGAVADRLVASLDAYGERWIAQHTAACEATAIHGAQTERVLDLRMRCLDDRRRTASALVSALLEPSSEAVSLAPGAIADLPPPERCADLAYLESQASEPSDPAVARRVEEARDAKAAAEAAFALGRLDDARSIVDELVVRAESIAHDPLIAELLDLRGWLRFSAGDLEGSFEDQERAYFAARRSGAAALAFEAATDLCELTISMARSPDQAERWLELARVELEASGLDDPAAKLLAAEASLAKSHGRYDEAYRADLRRVEQLEAQCGDRHCTFLLTAYRDAAARADQLEHIEQGLEHADHGLALARRLFGDQHLRTAEALATRGALLSSAARHADAVADLERATAILDATLPRRHMLRAITELRLGGALLEHERPRDARPHVELALELFTVLEQPSFAAAARMELGAVALASDDLDDAERSYRAALDQLRELYPEGHPNTANALAWLGTIAARRGHADDAIELLTQGIELRRRLLGDDAGVAKLRERLAEARRTLDLGDP